MWICIAVKKTKKAKKQKSKRFCLISIEGSPIFGRDGKNNSTKIMFQVCSHIAVGFIDVDSATEKIIFTKNHLGE